MSENDQEHYSDDEYHFLEDVSAAEPETGAPRFAPSTEQEAPASVKVGRKMDGFDVKKVQTFFTQNSPARNVVILFGVVFLLIILYKLTSHLFSSKKTVELPQLPQQTKLHVTESPTVRAVTEAPTTYAPQTLSPDLKQKLTAIEQAQTSLKTEMQVANNQVTASNANLASLSDKVNQLAQQLATLSSAIREQSELIVVLKEKVKSRPKPVRHVVPHSGVAPRYYLQAVIPGRAWIIGTNGSTMTVRDGSIIPGYGVVRHIDPIQGMVLTSTGQIIRFSQEDS